MTVLEQTCASIVPVCSESARAAQARLDCKTKPRGSLGRLEDLAVRLASIYRTPSPTLPAPAVVVFAADHGVAEEGVSAYPQEVTAQMVRNFAAGGAAINVLARQQRARIVVVDMGTRSPLPDLPEVRRHSLGPGTVNITRAAAMSRATARQGVEIGIELATEICGSGIGAIAIGEMGIGNTTASSAIVACTLGLPPRRVTGRGTGVDDARLALKIEAIEKALALNGPDPTDPLDVLAKVGGFEIAGLVGVMLGAAACKVPVVLDGFITGAAAMIATGLSDSVRDYLVAAHRSVEPGHGFVLDHLGLRPLLDLDLRLGEGTGAVLALHLLEASLRILDEMATFASASVTNAEA